MDIHRQAEIAYLRFCGKDHFVHIPAFIEWIKIQIQVQLRTLARMKFHSCKCAQLHLYLYFYFVCILYASHVCLWTSNVCAQVDARPLTGATIYYNMHIICTICSFACVHVWPVLLGKFGFEGFYFYFWTQFAFVLWTAVQNRFVSKFCTHCEDFYPK